MAWTDDKPNWNGVNPLTINNMEKLNDGIDELFSIVNDMRVVGLNDGAFSAAADSEGKITLLAILNYIDEVFKGTKKVTKLVAGEFNNTLNN
jgi:hypothetical protein